ncbi:hypothetical protein ANN_20189 [Periplaneta americana]|uniref:Uncharacterized protein n=1 Tax=Periplaneta americana TaxID=6978 RepID=A0ABQ8SC55_PERAM|nr:hypothetical protein ANN_20189 [Periplaneta americana]
MEPSCPTFSTSICVQTRENPRKRYSRQQGRRVEGFPQGDVPEFQGTRIFSSNIQRCFSNARFHVSSHTLTPTIDSYSPVALISGSHRVAGIRAAAMQPVQCDRKPYMTPPPPSIPTSLPSPPAANTAHTFYENTFEMGGHVARMGGSRNAYRVLVGKLEGKRPLGRPRRRWEDNIKMNLREVGYDDREWINLAQDRDQWRAYVRAAMNLREHRLRVFENKVLKKIFGAKRDEVTGEWRKLHNAELHALYSSPDIFRNIKSRRLRWAGHEAHMGESRNTYRVLVGRPDGKRPFGRPRRRWEDNIKMDLREVGCDDLMIETGLVLLRIGTNGGLMRTAGYTLLDRKRNEEILEQLEVESVEEKISRYKLNWLDHVRRTENSRIPKIMMQYKPRGHRRPGRPFRRLLDGAEIEDLNYGLQHGKATLGHLNYFATSNPQVGVGPINLEQWHWISGTRLKEIPSLKGRLKYVSCGVGWQNAFIAQERSADGSTQRAAGTLHCTYFLVSDDGFFKYHS